MKRTQIEWLTSGYEFAHGKKPRGDGLWAFKVNPGCNDTRYIEPILVAGTLSFAKESIKRILDERKTGFARVEVLS